MKITKEKESPPVASGRSHLYSIPTLAGATWLLAMQHHIVIALVSSTPFYDALLSVILSYMKRAVKATQLSKYLPIYFK